jgi:hypothetical protein
MIMQIIMGLLLSVDIFLPLPHSSTFGHYYSCQPLTIYFQVRPLTQYSQYLELFFTSHIRNMHLFYKFRRLKFVSTNVAKQFV